MHNNGMEDDEEDGEEWAEGKTISTLDIYAARAHIFLVIFHLHPNQFCFVSRK